MPTQSITLALLSATAAAYSSDAPFASSTGSGSLSGFPATVSITGPAAASPSTVTGSVTHALMPGTYPFSATYQVGDGVLLPITANAVYSGNLVVSSGSGCIYGITLRVASANCSRKFTLTWVETITGGGSCHGDTTYKISRAIGVGAQVVIATGVSGLSYIDADPTLPDSAIITYQVTGEQTVTTSNFAPGMLLCIPSPSWSGRCEGAQLTIQWAAVAGATSYVLLLDNMVVYTGTGLQTVITGLTIGTQYSISLVVVVGGVMSAPDTAILVTPCALYVPPTPPDSDWTDETPPATAYVYSGCCGG